MEFTEDLLRTIADNLVDIRLRLYYLQKLVLPEADSDRLDRLMEKKRESPQFQERCDQAFEDLKGSQSPDSQ